MMTSDTGKTALPRLPELLSPAGSPDALAAAIEAGADAVYLGASDFNARAGAKNFDRDALRAGVSLAHAYGVKVYVTLNTQVYDRELADYLATADEAYTAGADALITADVGGARLLRRYFPDFELHASTQMSGHNSDMAAGLKTLGFSRMVTARETSYADLVTLCHTSPIEIELFVHGALCVCHSGQCLFSSVVGGRSGNRGECAQPCRLPYGTKNRYPLSPKDLCLAEHIPEILSSGVASLKIEGRMKSSAYVYGVTKIWRRLLDERRAATPDEMRELSDLFSRGGFTDGYFTRRIDSSMLGVRSEEDKQVSRSLPEFPGLTRKVPLDMQLDVRAGKPVTLTVTAENGKSATVTGDAPERAQSRPTAKEEILPKLTRLGGTPYAARNVQVGMDEGLLLPFSAVNALRRAATDALTDKGRTSPGQFDGKLTANGILSAGNGITAIPADGACRNTVFSDRDAVSANGTDPDGSDTHSASENRKDTVKSAHAPENSAVCYRPSQITPRARAYFDRIYLPADCFGTDANEITGAFPGSGTDAARPLADGVVLPPVIFDSERDTVRRKLLAARAAGAVYALVGNIGHLRLAREAGLIPVGDFRMNICNGASLSVALALGCESVVLSPELTLPRLRDLSRGGKASAIIYGRIPLMILEKCVGKEIGGCDRCHAGTLTLTDRIGVSFPVLRAAPHRSLILNSVPTYMADRAGLLKQNSITARHFLFTTETPNEVDRVIEAYEKALPPMGSIRRIGQ